MRLRTIFLIGFSLLTVALRAQRLDFTHLSVENGLSQKSVLAIAQDSRGFMWFGTANGLNRYDSRTFKTYTYNASATNGVCDSYILSLLSDSRGNLWIGTTNGLDLYRPQTDDFEHIELNRPDKKTRKIINCIAEDGQHRIWIGTTTGLYLLKSSAQKNLISYYKAGKGGLNGNNVHAILPDDSGNIWVGTDKGLSRLSAKGNSFSFETFRHTSQLTSLADDNVASLVIDNQHQIWIGLHEKGLDYFNAAGNSFSHYLNSSDLGSGLDNVRKIIPDGDKLWIGTQDGLSVFNIGNKQFFTYKHNPDNPKSLNQNSIYSLLIDRDHTLWIGTYFGGVNIATSPIFKIYQNNNTASINNNVVSSIVEDDHHNLWIGTEGGGLNVMNQKDQNITVYQHQKNNPASISSSLIKTIYQDHEGNIWAGTHGGGLNVMTPGKPGFTKYLYNDNDAVTSNSEVRAVAESDGGLFWVGMNTGLRVFKRNKTTLAPLTDKRLPGVLGSQTINGFYLDAHHNLWIAAWGLFVSEKGTSPMKPYQPDNFNARVNCVTGDAAGNIWAGTDNKGLLKYDLANKITTNYTENEGLANNSVYAIVQDLAGNMWISTGNGLSNLNVKTGVFHNYTASDGLAGNEFNKNASIRLASGEILLGGFNGFTGFYPDQIRERDTKPFALITGLKLFNKPVAVGDSSGILPSDISMSKTIRFQYTQNVFTVDFVILNYIRAEKNKYAYEIQNIDRNWNYTSLPSATYNNLPPGKYHFLAKGQNSDGVWSDPVSLLIEVLPPWWRTWWAYSLYVIALAAVIFLVVRFFFIRELLKRDQELTALKLNFFTNISHEIRTYLSLISAPVEKLLMNRKTPDDETQQLQTIKRNSDELLQLVNELMDFRKAETGNLSLHISKLNIVPFIQSICQSFEDLATEKNIRTELVLPPAETILYFDKEQMRKVLFNLLSNAYKFTPSGGKVSVSILELPEEIVSIQVADNGKGISPENLERLFQNYFQENDYGHQNTGYGIGLALSKSIVALHHGELRVESHQPESAEDFSTIFTINLKKGKLHLEGFELLTEDHPAETRSGYSIIQPPALTLNEPGIGDQEAKKYTVLIVEDNNDVRKFLTDAFKQQYQVLEALNGRIGFEIASEQIPDLIISDVMMPEMDGFTFCHTIKTDERTNHIPVILLTAKSSVPSQVSGLEMGADVYLTKPFSIQILGLQVQNLINSAEKMRRRFSAQIVTLPAENGALPIADTSVQTEKPVINEFISKIIALAETQISNPDFDVEMICRNIGMSQTVLYKKVKAITDLTVNDIVKEVRFKKAAQLISEQKYTVYEVAGMVGYDDVKYFSREFKKQFGVSPRDYKQLGADA